MLDKYGRPISPSPITIDRTFGSVYTSIVVEVLAELGNTAREDQVDVGSAVANRADKKYLDLVERGFIE